MLLIPRSERIRTRPIAIGAGSLSATTYVTFEDVKVPSSYLIGKEGKGFMYTMTNFNHERLWIVFQSLRGCRMSIHDTMAWAQKREAFGQTLIQQPVVRWKFGNMARKVEALQAWTEQVVYELEELNDLEGGCFAPSSDQSTVPRKLTVNADRGSITWWRYRSAES